MPRRKESNPGLGSTDTALFNQIGMENSKSPHLPVQMATSKTLLSFRVNMAVSDVVWCVNGEK
jgi:hypothetical protein